MREQLNSNPMVQMGAIALLLAAAAIFLLTSMGGGGEEAESGSGAIATTLPGEGAAPSPGEEAPATAAPSAAMPTLATQPPPQPVLDAWNGNRTVVLLIVNDGGVDGDLVRIATTRLDGMPGVSTFVVPAGEIARYASITQGVGVNRVPALVVVSPKKLNETVPTATVSYGFQDGESVEQAVIDAGYKGPTLEYHP